jgi:NAD(P)-dependent dehydrogenase (short-subunit alcohol dehydrogenase family)
MIEAEGRKAAAIEMDVTREADCRRLADHCVALYGGIDILHNNVASARATPAHSIEINASDDPVTLRARCSPASTSPVMRERGGGAIITVSSIA